MTRPTTWPGRPTTRGSPEEVLGRALVVRKLAMVPIECVARGYLTGSGLLDYQRDGKVCGIALPPGLVEASRFDEPLFTPPATKAELGEHDENISFDRAVELVGPVRANQLRERTLQIYLQAADHALTRGIIIADTKFEFGVDADGRVVLADEVFTPDSSRYWPADTYKEGGRCNPASTSSSSATGSPGPNQVGTATVRRRHRLCRTRSSRPPAPVTSRPTNAFRGLSFGDWIGAGA